MDKFAFIFQKLHKMKNINFSNNNLEEYPEIVENILNTKSAVESIDLTDCQIKFQPMLLSNFIGNNSNLIELELSGNEVNENPSLNFSKSILSLESLKVLKLPRIDTSILSNNDIFKLNDAKFKLDCFEYGNDINNLFLFEFFKKILTVKKKLKILNLKNSHLNKQKFDEIDFNELKSLNELILNNNEFSVDNLILPNSDKKYQLKKLHYSKCDLKLKKFMEISDLNNIKYINLSFNYLDNMRIKEKKIQANYIKELHLKQCALNNKFLMKFKDCLDKFESLQILNLSNNEFSIKKTYIFFEKMIKILLNLKEFYFYGNDLKFDSITKFFQLILDMKLNLFNSKNMTKSYSDFVTSNEFLNDESLNLKQIRLLKNQIEYSMILKVIDFGKLTDISPIIYIEILNENKISVDSIVYEESRHDNNLSKEDITATLNAIRNQNIKEISFENKFIDEPMKKITENLILSDSRILKLNIKNCSLNEKNCQKLDELIGKQPTLKEINLGNNENLGVHVCSNIFKRINSNFCLTKIDFSRTGITEEIGDGIGNAIGSQTSLYELKLSFNALGDNVGKSIFQNMSKNIKTMQIIEMSSCNFSGSIQKELDEALRQQANLIRLDLSKNNLEEECVETIANNASLSTREINLEDCDVYFTDMITELFFRTPNSQITEFLLSRNSLSKETAIELFKNMRKNCQNLVTLKVSDCNIDYSIEHHFSKAIGEQKKLKILDISKNKLLSEIGNEIFQAIEQKCINITELLCNDCHFDENVGNSLANCLMRLTNLEVLDISHNELGSVAGDKIFEKISSSCKLISVLKSSNCGFYTDMTDNIATAISKQLTLKHLDISRNNFGSTLGKKIFTLSAQSGILLETFLIDNCCFNGNLLQSIEEFMIYQKNFIELNISNNPLGIKIGECIFYHLKKNCSRIKKLNISNCEFNNTLYNDFTSFLMEQNCLEELNISYNKIIESEDVEKIFKALTSKRNLKIINFNSCKLNDKSKNYFSSFLSYQTNLIEINFSNNQFSEDFGQKFLKSLSENCDQLSVLNLNNCSLTNKIMNLLEKIIKKKCFLKILNIGNNNLNSSGFHPQFSTKKLTELDLNKCNLDYSDERRNSLSFLSKQMDLSKLNLSFNKIGSVNGIKLFESLQRFCFLKVLSLVKCGLDKRVAPNIGYIIKEQVNLKEIQLSLNDFGPEGGNTIFQMLNASPKRINSVALADCGLDQTIGYIIQEAIGNQSHLKSLNLSNNALQSNTCKDLLNRIKNGCLELSHLSIANCMFETGKENLFDDENYLKELNICRNPVNSIPRVISIKMFCKRLQLLSIDLVFDVATVVSEIIAFFKEIPTLKDLFLHCNYDLPLLSMNDIEDTIKSQFSLDLIEDLNFKEISLDKFIRYGDDTEEVWACFDEFSSIFLQGSGFEIKEGEKVNGNVIYGKLTDNRMVQIVFWKIVE